MVERGGAKKAAIGWVSPRNFGHVRTAREALGKKEKQFGQTGVKLRVSSQREMSLAEWLTPTFSLPCHNKLGVHPAGATYSCDF